jgi:hypothetical protein
MLLGIGLFSAITATITSFMVETAETHRHPVPAADRLRELVALRDEGLVTAAEFESRRAKIVSTL